MALIQAELAEVPSIHSYTSVEEIDRWRTARERSAVDRIVEILLRLDCHVVCRMTWICSTGLVTHVTVSKVLLSRSIDDVVAFELEQRNIVVLPNVPIDQLHRACLVTNATLQYSLESISHGTLDYSLATRSKVRHSLVRSTEHVGIASRAFASMLGSEQCFILEAPDHCSPLHHVRTTTGTVYLSLSLSLLIGSARVDNRLLWCCNAQVPESQRANSSTTASRLSIWQQSCLYETPPQQSKTATTRLDGWFSLLAVVRAR